MAYAFRSAPRRPRAHWRHSTGRTPTSGLLRLCALLAGLLYIPAASADEITVAVASNFARPAQALAQAFEAETGHRLVLSNGSTGQLFAQIANGAPFDIFLSADEERPRLLEERGLGVAGTRFTFALGRLVLWSPAPRFEADAAEAYLRKGGFRFLALANPELAPYGLAARQVLEALGLWDALRSNVVLGENIAQTFAMVSTGNSEAGFVALAQLVDSGSASGSRWDVPAALHEPIRQQAVLLARAEDSAAARDFLAFLAGEQARALVEAAGYGLD